MTPGLGRHEQPYGDDYSSCRAYYAGVACIHADLDPRRAASRQKARRRLLRLQCPLRIALRHLIASCKFRSDARA